MPYMKKHESRFIIDAVNFQCRLSSTVDSQYALCHCLTSLFTRNVCLSMYNVDFVRKVSKIHRNIL